MRSAVVALAVLLPSIAAAQPGAAPAQPVPTSAKLLGAGRAAARAGNCDTAASIGEHVREADPAYHAQVYAPDPVIRGCIEGIDQRPRPPGTVAPVAPAGPESPTAAPAIYGSKKSENVALALSLGGTLASYAMIAVAVRSGYEEEGSSGSRALATAGSLGVWFAPSFGHWYAGKFATRGLGLRMAGGGVALVALLWAFSECPIFGDHCDETAGPPTLALAGLGLFVYGTIDDIVTAPGRVRDYNKRLAGNLAVIPTVHPGGGTLSLAGRF